MKAEFETETYELMLTAVRAKRQRRRRTVGVGLLAIVCLSAQFIVMNLREMTDVLAPVQVSQVEEPMSVKSYTVIETQSGLYRSANAESPQYAVILRHSNENYSVVNEAELLASLPDNTGIRIEADGSGTLVYPILGE